MPCASRALLIVSPAPHVPCGRYELFHGVKFPPIAAMAMGELNVLHELMDPKKTLVGAYLSDSSLQEALVPFFSTAFCSWNEDGFCYSTAGTFLLMHRALHAYLSADDDVSLELVRLLLQIPCRHAQLFAC